MLEEWRGGGSRGSRERKDGIKEKERKIRMGAKRQKERRDTVNIHRRTQGGRNHRILLHKPARLDINVTCLSDYELQSHCYIQKAGGGGSEWILQKERAAHVIYRKR